MYRVLLKNVAAKDEVHGIVLQSFIHGECGLLSSYHGNMLNTWGSNLDCLRVIIIVNTIILPTENTVAYTILVCASLFLGLLMYFPCCGKRIHNKCHHHLQDHL